MDTTKFMFFLTRGDKDWTQIPYSRQNEILSSFPSPKDDFDRSYYQYRCQTYFVSRNKRFIFNAITFVILPFLLLVLLLIRLFRSKRRHIDAISSMGRSRKFIPPSLLREFIIDYDTWTNCFSLSFNDLKFVFKIICKTPFSPYYLFKVILKLAAYSDMIYLYSPRAFIVKSEYSFTSSLTTTYVNLFYIEHINVMHGEKIFFIRDSFFRYNRCYIWDVHYKKLFSKLRAEESQFIIEQPPALHLDIKDLNDKRSFAKYKYYLQTYDEQELQCIINSFSFVDDFHRDVMFRPHPIFSNLNILKKYISSSQIENPHIISIEQSLANTDNVVSTYSTVLYQAYLLGINVILDDMSNNVLFEKLKEHDYILSNKKNIEFLSQYHKS